MLLDHLRPEIQGNAKIFHCLLMGHNPQGVQPFPVFGQTHRHQSDAVKPRMQLFQIPKAAKHLRSVIDAGTKHQLGVDLNACFGEHGQITEGICRPGIFQHLHPQLRVRWCEPIH